MANATPYGYRGEPMPTARLRLSVPLAPKGALRKRAPPDASVGKPSSSTGLTKSNRIPISEL
ncbi:hypothetical protein HW132_31400 [Brasilonema sp. CT11]|nr:hypothetical protein [Brasilonema sp. CT11]